MRKRVVAIALVVASAINAPLICWIYIRLLFYSLAAYHVLDVPPSWLGWFSFFDWAARLIPFVWLTCFILAIVELIQRKRIILLATYLGAPFLAAAIYYVAWLVFLHFLVRTQAHIGFWG